MIEPDLEPDSKKYNILEPLLQPINKGIALSRGKIRRNQDILEESVPILIAEMGRLDPMFERMSRNIYYGGSYYDGLKTKSPDEFDLDVVFSLPKLTKPSLIVSDIAGFVQVKLTEYNSFKRNRDSLEFSKMDKFVDAEHFLKQDKFREWFEGLLNRAKNNVNQMIPFEFTLSKSGPAFTLKIYVDGELLSVDLVPCFIFGAEKWPARPFRPNPVSDKPNFLIVPKPPYLGSGGRHWRLSFQEQERVLIIGRNRLKDTIRLMKLLRDQQGHDLIASYYIKTVVLWMSEFIDDSFWDRHSMSYALMMTLKYYSKLLEARTIPYYWNNQNNLLRSSNEVTIQQFSQRIKRIIKDIERTLQSPSELKEILNKYFGPNAAKRISEGISVQESQDAMGGSSNSCTIL